MGRKIAAEVYLELTPTISSRYDRSIGGQKPFVDKLRITALFQNKPAKSKTQFIKVKVYVPEEVFLPFLPEAIINVPADLVETAVVVEAVNPNT